jgi:hypothetical protein
MKQSGKSEDGRGSVEMGCKIMILEMNCIKPDQAQLWINWLNVLVIVSRSLRELLMLVLMGVGLENTLA